MSTRVTVSTFTCKSPEYLTNKLFKFIVVEVGLCIVRDVLSEQETRVLLNDPRIS